jgi:actin-related protein
MKCDVDVRRDLF